jgi:hypothetical protein
VRHDIERRVEGWTALGGNRNAEEEIERDGVRREERRREVRSQRAWNQGSRV